MSAALELRGVAFAYAGAGPAAPPVLRGADLVVGEGAFALLVGATGSGKSTLMRLAKPQISPAGRLKGAVRVFGEDVRALDDVASARAVGYVFQDPDAQVVCDTVWHEMAFGLENLGVPEPEMRRRVADTCTFLGMEPWFMARTAELSGGQRQVLALAAALALRPRVLLLDEPTSMLDPVAERRFLSLLFDANRRLGVTVVVATHSPRELLSYATCAFELADGRVRELGLDELAARPDPLAALSHERPQTGAAEKDALVADDVWYRYERGGRWVLRGLDLAVGEGEVCALRGSNGSGKSTLLSLAAGVARPQRGRVRNALAASQALLPQDPRALLACETVREELMEWAAPGRCGAAEADAALEALGLGAMAGRHPYDLSGGQQQLLALEKLLITRPRLLLLDEPTKGLDDAFRLRVARRVLAARDSGATVLLATHDLGFADAVADREVLLFDGAAV